MLAQMQPYTPSLYRPGSFARYRQYPRNVVAPIPGVGYDVGNLQWAEQELNLDGSASPQPYGSYASVPLRGLGSLGVEAPSLFSGMETATERLAFYERLPPNLKSQVPQSTVDKLRREAAAEAEDQAREPWPATEPSAPPPESERAASAAEAAARAASYMPPPEPGFFDKKVGPVPLWAIVGGGALAVVGGGAWWWMKRRKR
jgi:hypothetical protein